MRIVPRSVYVSPIPFSPFQLASSPQNWTQRQPLTCFPSFLRFLHFGLNARWPSKARLPDLAALLWFFRSILVSPDFSIVFRKLLELRLFRDVPLVTSETFFVYTFYEYAQRPSGIACVGNLGLPSFFLADLSFSPEILTIDFSGRSALWTLPLRSFPRVWFFLFPFFFLLNRNGIPWLSSRNTFAATASNLTKRSQASTPVRFRTPRRAPPLYWRNSFELPFPPQNGAFTQFS